MVERLLGQLAGTVIYSREHLLAAPYQVQPGERLLIMTPGGGGLGDPEAREPALIAKDVREERTTEKP